MQRAADPYAAGLKQRTGLATHHNIDLVIGSAVVGHSHDGLGRHSDEETSAVHHTGLLNQVPVGGGKVRLQGRWQGRAGRAGNQLGWSQHVALDSQQTCSKCYQTNSNCPGATAQHPLQRYGLSLFMRYKRAQMSWLRPTACINHVLTLAQLWIPHQKM